MTRSPNGSLKDTTVLVVGRGSGLARAITLAALEAGKHVLTEARMALDAEQAHADQVHRLASHYHWTEEAIAKVPAWRRQAYLECIEGGEL